MGDKALGQPLDEKLASLVTKADLTEALAAQRQELVGTMAALRQGLISDIATLLDRNNENLVTALRDAGVPVKLLVTR